MKFGDYLKNYAKLRALQKELADLSGFSNAEISKIESVTKKTFTRLLKAIAPTLILLIVLMTKAGYLEEVVNHSSYTEYIFKDDDGTLADIVEGPGKCKKADSDWANVHTGFQEL